jgi:hypothetical protein
MNRIIDHHRHWFVLGNPLASFLWSLEILKIGVSFTGQIEQLLKVGTESLKISMSYPFRHQPSDFLFDLTRLQRSRRLSESHEGILSGRYHMRSARRLIRYPRGTEQGTSSKDDTKRKVQEVASGN